SRVRAASSRTKGSKMRSRSAGSIPTPVSLTAISAHPSATCSASSARPPRGVYFTAFSTSFITARRRAIASPITAAGARSLTPTTTPRSSATRPAMSAISSSSGSSSTRSRGADAGTERRESNNKSSASRTRRSTSSRLDARARRYSSPDRRARDHGAARGGERQTERDQDEERLQIAPERALGTLERHAHLDELHELAVARDRQRQQAHGLARGEPHGLEGRLAARGVAPGLRRERERLLPQMGRACARPTFGVNELEELVVEFRPEDLPQRRLGLHAKGGARSRPAGI